MSASPPWVPWLRCPRCAGSCSDVPPTCDACGFAYPSFDTIPVITARPHELVDQWRFRLAEFEANNESSRARIIADLATKTLVAGSRARLERLIEGMAIQRGLVVELLRSSGVTPTPRTVPEPEGVATEGLITSYIHHVHRDWGWDSEGSTENHGAIAAVMAVLDPTPKLGAMLVIGAGACRLASDLHRHADSTVAVDINPLPMIVARRVIAGQRVRLLEFPLAPRDLAHAVVDRQLCTTEPVGAGFVQIFADAFALPFRDGCFDTVLTPWFIDQVPRDLATFLPVIAKQLRPGGTWINHGPLIYHPNRTELAARYPSDELFALVEAAGFTIERQRSDRLPYLQSPACTRGRAETVFTFAARRGEPVPVVETVDDAPAWTTDATLGVPRFAGLGAYRAVHPLFAAVVRLIDGERSATQIAAVLVRDHGLPADAATPGVLSCLREIWRATR